MAKNKNLYAVILAGGSGTRFWPASRSNRPKQFIKITGSMTLFQQTIKRIQRKIPGRNIIIVTNKEHKDHVTKQIAGSGIPKSNIFLEPSGKNTAPAVCWAASWIHQKNPHAVMVVLPSDHLIANTQAFLKCLSQAITLAKDDFLVTFGIVPSHPETGYGYLKTSKKKYKGRSIVKVNRFVEKPNLSTAKKYVKSKNYHWNSGMFIWKTEVILNEFRVHLPKVHKVFKNRPSASAINRNWSKLPSISVDYGIMERSNNVVTVPAKNIGWSDLGSWEALTAILKKGTKGRVLRGNVLDLGSQNIFVWGNDRLIATVGLSDVVVVDTPDALLVCRADCSQKVKDVVETLKKSKRKEIASPR